MSDGTTSTPRGIFPTRVKRIFFRSMLVVFGACLGLAVAEIAISVTGVDRMVFALPDSAAGLRYFISTTMSGGRIAYYTLSDNQEAYTTYPSDLRDYPGCTKIRYEINKEGFRGRCFCDRPSGGRRKRIAFLGDSFVFGAGVMEPDTLPEQTGAALRMLAGTQDVDVANFGIGGLNSVQELAVLTNHVLPHRPDIVVMVFNLNDTESPLFAPQFDRDGTFVGLTRTDRALDFVDQNIDYTATTGSFLDDLKTLRIAAYGFNRVFQSSLTEQGYHELHTPANPWYERNLTALRQAGRACSINGVQPVVVIFPILHRLNEYPFRQLHASIASVCRSAGMPVLDLYSSFADRDAADLWVHRHDHHPNRSAHGIAASAIARFIASLPAGSRVMTDMHGRVPPS